jgi:hypothetical protein
LIDAEARFDIGAAARVGALVSSRANVLAGDTNALPACITSLTRTPVRARHDLALPIVLRTTLTPESDSMRCRGSPPLVHGRVHKTAVRLTHRTLVTQARCRPRTGRRHVAVRPLWDWLSPEPRVCGESPAPELLRHALSVSRHIVTPAKEQRGTQPFLWPPMRQRARAPCHCTLDSLHPPAGRAV